eukprot:TRINITY_DN4652_c1_g1_i1.p1 TRINITY_DN4652_c1_g1~~TRINITY_DN4652_c1_g1_i1.p1  ORF type:complete len:364 (+),score=44.13 TRINITY_DN4652_c1_g1_i1:79-1092(+)
MSSLDKSSWVDEKACDGCGVSFEMLNRPHHCRSCAKCLCDDCCVTRTRLHTTSTTAPPQRTCAPCMIEAAVDAADGMFPRLEDVPEYNSLDDYEMPKHSVKEVSLANEALRNVHFSGAGRVIEITGCVLYNASVRGANCEMKLINCLLLGTSVGQGTALTIKGAGTKCYLNNCVVLGGVEMGGAKTEFHAREGSCVVGNNVGVCSALGGIIEISNSYVSGTTGIASRKVGDTITLCGSSVVSGQVNDNFVFNFVFVKGASAITSRGGRFIEPSAVLVGPDVNEQYRPTANTRSLADKVVQAGCRKVVGKVSNKLPIGRGKVNVAAGKQVNNISITAK